ncbi:sensor histidine kinase [Streptomyces sp. NBC_00286]|uniref:sensor histidine kinase n=1 Tax=Streptomyces sp. NBC_00286 TaxID=2975701 RepID=UPI002E2D56C3|nr:histidine kinase [Streptomyces sp. NBC_00286]
METLRNWLLPPAVAALLLVWPGPEALDGGYGLYRDDLGFTLVVAAGTTVALGLRRRMPLVALAGVAACYGLALLTAASDAVQMFVIVGDLVAVYSVAARTTLPVTLRAVGVLVCYQVLVGLAVDGASLEAGVGLAVAVAFHLGVVGLGRGRAHQSAARAGAAARLARARAEGQQAGVSERRRLARELHDVSAHHLTSVVVTAEAALHLAASRPELAAEALDFAARTGRETQTTVQRLVTSLGAAEEGDDVPLGTRLEELASGFIRLGQRVEITGVADVAAAGTKVTEAVFGIAREALTNTLRYAPGAVVRVGVQDLGDGWLALTVDDDGGSRTNLAAGASGRGLGSGRGMTGMRERAEAVGGSVTAGPGAGPSGGWSVRAELPAHPGQTARPSTGRSRALDWRLASHALLPAAGILPAVFLFTEDRDAPSLLLLGALLIVQLLPLLWRRSAPWPVLAALLAGAWLWPWAPGSDADPWLALIAGACALVGGVYAVGAYGRDPWATWASVPAAASVLAGAVSVTAARDGTIDGDPAGTLVVGITVFALTVMLLPLFGCAWLAGFLVRSRRGRIARREDGELGAVVHEALAAAHAERQRVAAGLRAAVLDRTAEVVTAAEEGRLDDVAPAARESLAAMRELLGSLRDGTPADARPVSPTEGSLQ